METKYYKASNTFSPISFILILLCTFILGSVISWPYLWLEEKIPFIYINVLIPIGAGILIGFIAGKLAKALKMHSPLFGVISILIGYVGFTVVKWAMYVYKILISEPGDSFITGTLDVLTNPSGFWSGICLINEYGTWGLSDNSTVSGIFLWIIWILEILLFFGCLAFTFHAQIDIPFDETVNAWANKYPTEFRFEFFNVNDVVSTIEKNPNALLEYPRLNTTGKVNYVSATIYQSHDQNANYLTLTKHVLDDKGNYSNDDVMKYLIVSRDFVNLLASNATAPTEEFIAE